MSGVNKVILVGRLGHDPSLRTTPGGTAVVRMSLATSEKVGQNREERTEWHRLVAFGRLAEVCHQYLTKGSQVYFEGRIQTNEWEDKDGAKRSVTEIIAQEMKMLDSKSRSDRTDRDGRDDNRRPQTSSWDDSGQTKNHKQTQDDIPF